MSKSALDRRPVVAQPIGDPLPALTPQHIQQGIAQDGEGLGRIPTRGLAPIFAQGHIPHVMHPILAHPMAPPEPLQLGHTRRFRRQAGHRIVHRLRQLPSQQFDPPPGPAPDLAHPGPAQPLAQLAAGFQGPDLQPAVPLLHRPHHPGL